MIEINHILTALDNMPTLMQHMDGYSQSAVVAEIDDIHRLLNGELNARYESDRNIIAAYTNMTNEEIIRHLISLYEFAFKEAINGLKETLDRENLAW